jgi:hypothetical protein
MKSLTTRTLAGAIVMTTVVSAGATAQHEGDIFLDVVDGRLATGGVAEGGGVEVPLYLFGARFGDSGCPPFTEAPGFDTLPGTFTFGTRIGWNALSGFRVWNGAGFEATGGETLEVSFISQSVFVEDEPIEGFSLAVQSDGGFHKHLSFCMNGCPAGCAPPDDADTGIYLLHLELYSTDPAVETSAPFYLVFNYEDDEATLAEAVAWLEDELFGVCPWDVTGDDTVDVADLVALLGEWGPEGGGGPADFNGDGIVDSRDLVDLLAAWGPCPSGAARPARSTNHSEGRNRG